MRKETGDRFGNRVRAERRVLEALAPAVSRTGASCLNCGNPLAGQYCSQCGQRSEVRLITPWELGRDVLGDVFELDDEGPVTRLPAEGANPAPDDETAEQRCMRGAADIMSNTCCLSSTTMHFSF